MRSSARVYGILAVSLSLIPPVAAHAGLAERVGDLNQGAWTTRWGGLCGSIWREATGELPGFVFGDARGAGCEVFTVDPPGGTLSRVAHLGESGARVKRILGAVDGVTYFIGADTLREGIARTDGTPEGTFFLFDDASAPHFEDLFRPASGRAFFWRDEPATGLELWRTDGTRQGTALVKDIRPGTESGLVGPLTAERDGVVYFSANDGTSGPQAWRSDGTTSGTFRLSDVPAAPSTLIGPFAALTGSVLFGVRSGSAGVELWRSDGTVGGTQPYWTDPESSSGDVWALAPLGDRALLGIARDEGLTLWVTDGTAAGTMELALLPNPIDFGFLPVVSAAGRWYFFADDGVHGAEPWVSDGTPGGTHLLADVQPGPAGSAARPDELADPPAFASLGDELLMTLDDGVHGIELWSTDGSGAPPVLVADLAPGGASSRPRFLGELGGLVLFDLEGDLWRTDGTAAGTAILAGFGGELSPSHPRNFTDAGAIFYFEGSSRYGNSRTMFPGRSDGTETGTGFLVGDLSQFPGWSRLTALDDGTLIGVSHGGESSLIWSSLGEEILPLVEIADVCPPSGSCPISFRPPSAGPVALFRCGFAGTGVELCATDGTLAGTGLLVDIVPGPDQSHPGAFVEAGDEAWFTAQDAADAEHAWRSSGTPGTTTPIAPLSEGLVWRADAIWPVDVESGRFYLIRRSGADFDREFWFSPGGGDPAVLLHPGLDHDIRPLGFVGERLLFAAREAKDPGVGQELWVSDGTVLGTRLLRDIWSGPNGSRLDAGAEIGGRLLFPACEPLAGCELWATDGTTAGTVRLLDLEAGAGSSSPRGVTRVGDFVYFSAARLETGRELWVTDGTSAGTFRLPELATGAFSSIAEGLNPAPARMHEKPTDFPFGMAPEFLLWQERIYFAGDDGTGAELWAMPQVLFYDGFESGDPSRWSLFEPLDD